MGKTKEVFEEDFEPAYEAIENEFEIEDGIPLAPRTRGGTRPQKYPFDKLAVGQSFHVPSSAQMPDPAKSLAGAVTNANTKWSHAGDDMETKVMAVYETGPDGKKIKTEDGHYVKIAEQTVVRPVRIQDRKFTIRAVGESDHKGVGARVFREV